MPHRAFLHPGMNRRIAVLAVTLAGHPSVPIRIDFIIRRGPVAIVVQAVAALRSAGENDGIRIHTVIPSTGFVRRVIPILIPAFHILIDAHIEPVAIGPVITIHIAKNSGIHSGIDAGRTVREMKVEFVDEEGILGDVSVQPGQCAVRYQIDPILTSLDVAISDG